MKQEYGNSHSPSVGDVFNSNHNDNKKTSNEAQCNLTTFNTHI